MGSVGGRHVRRVMARRQFIRRTGTLGLSLAAGPLLAALGSGAPIQTARAGEGRAELRFVFWGSINERNGVEHMIDTFNAANPMIHVTPQYIPTTGDTYTEKLTAMLASGDPPDAAYVTGSVAFAYASAGRLMDLSRYVKSDPSKLLPNAFYRYGNQIIGSSIGEITVLYYNKDLFDAAKAPHPPADPKDDWEWDQFLEIARKLTKDRNGNDATSGRFDPNNIETYGVAFNTANTGYLPLVWSNWGQFANDQGTRLTLNEPQAVDPIQRLQDLIYKYHVAPTPAVSQQMPATDILMQTRRVAMDLNGHWKVLDYSHTNGLRWDMGALPRLRRPATLLVASARVIFASTKHPNEAYQFYRYHIDPNRVELFKDGLWMPPQREYYDDPAMTDAWIDGHKGVYPAGAKQVLVSYVKHYIPHQAPEYWLRNLNQIYSKALNPALDLVWTGKAGAKQAMDQAAADAKPLMAGRWN